MGGIFSSIVHYIARIVSDVEKWVLKAVDAVYSYVVRQLRAIRNAANDVWHALTHFAAQIDKFLGRVVTYAKWIVTKYVPGVIRWALRNFDTLTKDIGKLVSWAARWVARLYNDIRGAVTGITTWVIRHIWDPLTSDIAQAWHWITHEGFLAWQIVAHPEMLMQIIGSYLWRSYLDLLRHYARPIARWLVSTMLSMQSEFADVLESIIANML